MPQEWIIILYKNSQGVTPAREFILGLEIKAQSKVYNSIELLHSYGIAVGPPHIKKIVGTELWELRILGSDSLRIIYIAITGKRFLLLHGFKKKTQKTAPKEIKIALDRLGKFRQREY